jgi:GR25 family glycosyltransferase involved in LPS biosynthesis
MHQQFEEVFLINLKHREDRLYFSKVRLNHLKIQATLIDGIVPENMPSGKMVLGKPDKGLYGCGLSHMKIYEHIEENHGLDGNKIFLILEDDFMPLVPEQEFRKYIGCCIKSLPDYWKVLLLGTSQHNNFLKEQVNEYISVAKKYFFTHCYVIKNNKPLFDRIKYYFNEGYWADQNFVAQQQLYDDIFVCNRDIVYQDISLISDRL